MALAVRPDMRKYKMGTKIIEESLKMAREAGAEYYKGKKGNLLIPGIKIFSKGPAQKNFKKKFKKHPC